ncbi:reverse transcriptase domain-containing protein [Photobacterium sanguinicancri]|uniref:reverse transcriptase domain-containing protein n=1 Tax=Photobacterium sanguinicancri TaxID=875932 RepID=UPI0021C35313|nr:reverse transcriptase domain-containing protein [Photobacterium sanguinicancri]
MLLDKKYNKLLPTEKYLLDEVILLNAWKKSHQHIRGINWYVDFLDLDKSAIELDLRISAISSALKSQKLKLSPLKLIPAPKSNAWEFVELTSDSDFDFGGTSLHWLPKPKKKKDESFEALCQPMRPLAHVSIDDQTLFTAFMMLLANRVESMQGDPSTDFDEVHEKKVINYGNRLHCTYHDGEAAYSWGNSNTYSKFFKDYQQFLARPIHFGREAKRVKTSEEQIYEVHLDFAKFYDSVERPLLIETISKLVKDMTGAEPDDCIKHVLDKFQNWRWTIKSKQLYKDVCRNEDIPILKNKKGIPQGLVAGGFLANIYMLDFDKHVSQLIGKPLTEDCDVMLVDACRYVDDLRLIVKAKKHVRSEKELAKLITSTFEPYTKKLNLTLQESKTKVKIFSSKEGAVSAKLADIQGKISGPMPLHELDEQLGHLEGLIELSDNLSTESLDEEKIDFDFTSELAFIDKTFNDVRKDTLLRFTANKIHNLLGQKRNMIAQEVNDEGKAIPGSWDYLQERMARKLVSRWTKDPSLLLLMKKGLELFPHVQLLRPILSNLEEVRQRDDKELVLFAEYCLSEILRHSATAIHTKDRWAFPAHSDPKGYFEYLENYASSKLFELDNLNEALTEQILFFCLIRNDSALKEELNDKTFNVITQLLNGFRNIDIVLPENEFSTAVLLAHQISLDKPKVIRSVVSALEAIYNTAPPRQSRRRVTRIRAQKLNQQNLANIGKTIMLGEPKFFEALYSTSKKQGLSWTKKASELASYLGLTDHAKVRGELSNYNDKKISLLSVLRSNHNPFKHENGILKLLLATLRKLDKLKFSEPIDIANSTVECSDWKALLRLESSCELNIEPKYFTEPNKLFHAPPKWLTDEHKPLYYIGMFIRSCLLGSVDWSGSSIQNQDRPAYRGIRSNMLKRQIGMMHSPEAFGESKSPMSDWLSSLLFKLLQWPGVDSSSNNYDWPNEWNLLELEKCIKSRLEAQSKGFCHLSNIPTYVEKVSLNWSKDKQHLNVIMVQPLLPLVDDFGQYGLKLDTPKYRAKHRRHVASVSELILHNIASVDSVNEKPMLKGKVDLIIWPELSVSPDDLDILERLSDKTGAIVFAGIGFSHINSSHELNNSAIWIIPNQKNSGRRFIKRLQGKWNMTAGEKGYITPWRPYQLIVELLHPAYTNQEGFKLTGSICYDATDIELSADLKEKSNAYIISAMNKDIATFDSMVDALFYHMYQHVVLVNSGEFGGSVAKAPYKERFHKLITHAHGSHQVSISSFEMNMFDFRSSGSSMKSNKPVKTPPAGNSK